MSLYIGLSIAKMKRKNDKHEKKIAPNGKTFLGVNIPAEHYEFMASRSDIAGLISHQVRQAIRQYVEREEAKS